MEARSAVHMLIARCRCRSCSNGRFVGSILRYAALQRNSLRAWARSRQCMICLAPVGVKTFAKTLNDSSEERSISSGSARCHSPCVRPGVSKSIPSEKYMPLQKEDMRLRIMPRTGWLQMSWLMYISNPCSPARSAQSVMRPTEPAIGLLSHNDNSPHSDGVDNTVVRQAWHIWARRRGAWRGEAGANFAGRQCWKIRTATSMGSSFMSEEEVAGGNILRVQ